MLSLGIETSCDETSIGIVRDDVIINNLIYTQNLHSEFGGVIPELASRAHLQKIYPLLEKALKDSGITLNDLDLICATAGPGLIGALIVGFNFTKALAYANKKLFIPVNHIYGHMYSCFLEEKKPQFPLLCLIVSGGHTALYKIKNFYEFEMLGTTLDDAAGEAFDKVGKLLGFNYPAGPEIEKTAEQGDENSINFPIAKLPNTFNFSFSGIKTSVLRFIQKELGNKIDDNMKANIAASFQNAVLNALVNKLYTASREFKINNIAVVGGVAANKGLIGKVNEVFNNNEYKTFFPSKELCSDNGAMIAYAGLKSFETGYYLKNPILKPFPNLADVENINGR